MRKFTDKEIFDRIKQVQPNFKRTVNIPLIVGIQSKADIPDVFDDKFFLYDGNNNFILGTTGTTNAGLSPLKNFIKYQPKGTAVWETNRAYNKCFRYGLHRSKMEALRLDIQIYYYRDNNSNDKTEQIGERLKGNPACNFHGISYEKLQGNKKIATRIGDWSQGCQVCNNMSEYGAIIDFVKPHIWSDYVLLKEW